MMTVINHNHTDGTLAQSAESADGYIWLPPVVDLDTEEHDGCALCGLDADIRVGRWLYGGVQGKHQVCNHHIDFVREYGFDGMAPRSLLVGSSWNDDFVDTLHNLLRGTSGGICSLCGGTEAEGYRMFVVAKLVFCLDHAMDVRRYGPIGAAGKMFMRLRVRAIEVGDDQMLTFTDDMMTKISK